MKLKRGCRGMWLILPLLFIDRITKLLALKYLAPGGVKKVIHGILSWSYVENRGMAFGMASGMVWLLIVLTALVIAAILAYLIRHPDDPAPLRLGLWLVIGGGLGNLYDRIAYGFVVDFIRADFVDFPVFNGADVFVCAGVALVILAVLMSERRKEHGG